MKPASRLGTGRGIPGSGKGAAFERTLAAKRRADESPQLGREFVEEYVKYVHYLEDVHNVIAGDGSSHDH